MSLQTPYNKPQPIAQGEKIIAAASYLTAGVVGFFWLIISHIAGSRLKNFLRFHIYQSIFLSILYYVFNVILSIMVGIVVKIPFIGSLVYSVYFWIFDLKLIFNYSIVDTFIFIVIAYLALNSLVGRYGRLPWVSKVIKSMM